MLEELREAGEVDLELRKSRAIGRCARGAAIPSGRTLTRAEMLDLVDGLFVPVRSRIGILGTLDPRYL